MKKDWIVAFGTDKFYLTEEEARFYSTQLADGKKFVVLKSGLVLSDKCLYVVRAETIEEAGKMEFGKWQCKNKTWHNKGAVCYCTASFKELSDGSMRII